MTIVHEVAQELADYIILTDAGKLSPFAALSLNFASGLSVMLGAIIVLATTLEHATVGLILAFGGGVYLHVACSEAMPTVYANAEKASERFACLLMFVIGAVLIGIVLIDHAHCSLNPDADLGDAHAGHNH